MQLFRFGNISEYRECCCRPPRLAAKALAEPRSSELDSPRIFRFRKTAQVAELADARASGARARKGVRVRVSPWAPTSPLAVSSSG